MPKQPSTTTSQSLLFRAQQSDEAAWERLSLIYAPIVYEWARKARLQAADAADVVQEVFQAVAIHIKGFRADEPDSTFRGWLWTLFHSKLMDHFRRNKRLPAPAGSAVRNAEDSVDESELTSGIQQGDDSAKLLHRALEIIKDDFHDRTWQAFWRTTMQSERVKDVAQDLDISPAAVCMCRTRVIRRLRETLDGLDILAD